jgi:hypothetical protein
MAADRSKRYNHDGISYRAFTPGPCMAVLRPFSASQHGGEAGLVARR